MDQAKLHLRIDNDDTTDDLYISTLINVAREYCEDFCHVSLGTATFEYVLDGFPGRSDHIELNMSPLQSIDYVTYNDAGNNPYSMDPTEYVTDIDRLPGALYLPYFGIWPVIVPLPGAAVRIGFTAGYTSANMPQRFIAAMLLLIGSLYLYREQVSVARKIQNLPTGIDDLLWPCRIF